VKKLICEQDIRELAERGESRCVLEGPAIITPAARDAADAAGITFQERKGPPEKPDPAGSDGAITPELVLKVLQRLAACGRLPPLFCEAPYICEEDESGLVLLRGDSVRMDPCGPENPNVRRQSLLGGKGAEVQLLEIDGGTYAWAAQQDEKGYVLEGSATVTAAGRRYTARQGDCVFVPQGTAVEVASARCKLLCAACGSGGVSCRRSPDGQ